MTPTHAPEHIWTVVAVVVTIYAALIVWMGRRIRKRRRLLEAVLGVRGKRRGRDSRGGTA
jgi:hypothetical protein